MNGYLPEKELIFFNPGKPGVVYTHSAHGYITVEQLLHVQEYLVMETAHPVVYIEDRRTVKRPAQEVKFQRAVGS